MNAARFHRHLGIFAITLAVSCCGSALSAAGWGTWSPSAVVTSQPTVVYSPVATQPAAMMQPAASWATPGCTPSTTATQPGAIWPSATTQTPSYRSSWFRVPVTAYRAVPVATTTTMPATTVPATAPTVQPCNTFQWQPGRTANGWLSDCCLFRWLRPAPAPAVGAAPTAVSSPCGTPATMVASSGPAPTTVSASSCGVATTVSRPCGTCGVSSAASAGQPYYAPPAASSAAPLSTPGTTILPSSPVPADSRPRLDPAGIQPIPSASGYRIRVPGAQAVSPNLQPNPPTNGTPVASNPNQTLPPQPDAAGLGQPSATARLQPPQDVTPIPDEKRQSFSNGSGGLLKLPDPPAGDRTASVRSSAPSPASQTPVSWPAATNSNGSVQAAAASAPIVWDDTGWQTEQPTK